MTDIPRPIERAGVPDPARREFLSLAWRALSALAVGEAAFLGYRYLESRADGGVFGGVVEAGRLDAFAPGTITAFTNARFFMVCMEDGGLLALYSRCTHLACQVAWSETDGRFYCPCHGSEFERDGEVLNPPAPRPLDRFPIALDGRKVVVDTGQPVKRSQFNWSDLVYPPEA